jgi:adenylate cyclase
VEWRASARGVDLMSRISPLKSQPTISTARQLPLSTNKRHVTRNTVYLVIGACIGVHLLFALFPNVFEVWNAQTVDKLFVFRSGSDALRPLYDSTLVHIDISDKTLQELQYSYLNRFQYARVVQNLGETETALQVWDFIFPARANPVEDSVFVASTAKAGNVYFGLAFNIAGENQAPRRGRGSQYDRYVDSTVWNIAVTGPVDHVYEGIDPKSTFPTLARASRGLGLLNINFDRDGVYRRVPLLFRHGAGFYPSIAFRAACDYLNVSPNRIELNAGKSITLRSAHRPGGPAHDITIPVDESACMLVNYIGPLRRDDSTHSMLHCDFAEILRASDDRTELDLWRDMLQGKIALVSEVATGAADVGPVPTDNQFPLSGVHSNALNTILTENFLREASRIETLAIEAVVIIVLILFSLRLSSRSYSLGAIGLILGYLLLSAVVFLYFNLILDVLRPVLQIAGSAFGVVAYHYVVSQREKQSLQRSFEAYFPPTVVKRIMANPELITQGGQKKELTILFSDIKSFTTHSSTMTPHEIQKALNEYFEAMVEIVFKYEGTVDKFIGDGLMVFFGDPEDQPDHAVRCVRAAIDMQQKTRTIRAQWEREGKFPLQIRIGINTGPVVVGNMGSARRLSYTVLGSDVNLAQRLESNAPVGGILISHRTFELIDGLIPAKPLEPIKVKGLDVPIRVYEVPV